jgi:anti-anti-sigma factor
VTANGKPKKRMRRVVRPGGDITASTAGDFREELQAFIDAGCAEMVIDLSRVETIDSVGIGVLIATHNTLRQMGGHLRVTNASGKLLDLFHSMGLHRHFKVSGIR